jgi:hypothetical protein
VGEIDSILKWLRILSVYKLSLGYVCFSWHLIALTYFNISHRLNWRRSRQTSELSVSEALATEAVELSTVWGLAVSSRPVHMSIPSK